MSGPDENWHRAGLVVLAILLFHSGQTLFNDVADVAVDRVSSEPGRRNRASVQGSLPLKLLLAVGWLLVGAAGVVSSQLPWTNRILFLLALPLVHAYNFKPVGMSGRPLATQLFWPATWMIMYFYCAGALELSRWRQGVPYLVFVVVFMGIGEGLSQDVRDADNDELGGRTTTVVRFGVARTSGWACGAFALSVLPWVWFTRTSGLGLGVSCGALALLIMWAWRSWRAAIRLRHQFHKAEARLLHVGAIATFTTTNVLTIIGLARG
jgi:4-hydroxybenzoate polyprenyltransferase